MCLTLTSKYPSTQLVASCAKQLERPYHSRDEWCTPFACMKIPPDGVLRAEPWLDRSRLYRRGRYSTGGIHAYRSVRQANQRCWLWGKHKIFEAYALYPLARGRNGDMIARAVYIPELDYSFKQADRVDLLETPQLVTPEAITRMFSEEAE